jgi:hypothetical protein
MQFAIILFLESEEQRQVDEILKNPEISEIFRDSRIIEIMRILREHPEQSEAVTRQAFQSPSLRRKIMKLREVGLLGVQSS